ncbi:GtrA-like protein [Yersinia aldovae]|uniref:GtrA-like protein n=1 Tax=Yersinia aldovae TaxID=29483 RepID=A0A0T9UXE9_YERAL|nr:GtrA family protein [Yersinia aldovae]CNL80459.1 GtrA-like protein [Yersinia aldovae]
MMKILREFFFFGISGIIGFLVDTAVLYLLRGCWGPFIARGFSFFAAVLVTWLFNRAITFKKKRSGMNPQNEFFSYLLLMLGGGVINYGLYSWLITAYKIVLENPIIGIAAGSIAGMVVNLATSRFILFRKDIGS